MFLKNSHKQTGQITLAFAVLVLMGLIASSTYYLFQNYNILNLYGIKSKRVEAVAELIMQRMKMLVLYPDASCDFAKAFKPIKNFNLYHTKPYEWHLNFKSSQNIYPIVESGYTYPAVSIPNKNVAATYAPNEAWVWECIVTKNEARGILFNPSYTASSPDDWSAIDTDNSIQVKVIVPPSVPDYLNLTRLISIQLKLITASEDHQKGFEYEITRNFNLHAPVINDFNIIFQDAYNKFAPFNRASISLNNNSYLEVYGSVLYVTKGVSNAPAIYNHIFDFNNFFPANTFNDVAQSTASINFFKPFLTTSKRFKPAAHFSEANSSTIAGYDATQLPNVNAFDPLKLRRVFKAGIELGAMSDEWCDDGLPYTDCGGAGRGINFNLPVDGMYAGDHSMLANPQFATTFTYGNGYQYTQIPLPQRTDPNPEANPATNLNRIMPIPKTPYYIDPLNQNDCIANHNCPHSDYDYKNTGNVGIEQSSAGIPDDLSQPNYPMGSGLVRLEDTCLKESVINSSGQTQTTNVGETFVYQRATEDFTIDFDQSERNFGNVFSGQHYFCGMIMAKTLHIKLAAGVGVYNLFGTFIVNQISIEGPGSGRVRFYNPKDNFNGGDLNQIKHPDGTLCSSNASHPENYCHTQASLYQQWSNHMRDIASNFFRVLAKSDTNTNTRLQKDSPFFAQIPSAGDNNPNTTFSPYYQRCYTYGYFGKYPDFENVPVGSVGTRSSTQGCIFVDSFDLTKKPGELPNHFIDQDIMEYNGCKYSQNLGGSDVCYNNSSTFFNTTGITSPYTFNADLCFPNVNDGKTTISNVCSNGNVSMVQFPQNYFKYYIEQDANGNTYSTFNTKPASGDVTLTGIYSNNYQFDGYGYIYPTGSGGQNPSAGAFAWPNPKSGEWIHDKDLWLINSPNIYECKGKYYQGSPPPYNNACIFRGSKVKSTSVAFIPSTVDFGFCNCYGDGVQDQVFWTLERTL